MNYLNVVLLVIFVFRGIMDEFRKIADEALKLEDQGQLDCYGISEFDNVLF